MLDQITPIILTFNEVDNVMRVLRSLRWASDIVVVDSLSTDGTVELVDSLRTTRLFRRPFDSHAMQWSYALNETKIRTEWVLALDADYVVSENLIAELASLDPDPLTSGYSVCFDYCIAGKPLRASLYPPVTVLFRRAKACYIQDGHTQRVVIDGSVGRLAGKILHDDRKPLLRWLESQQRYAKLEAEHLLSANPYSRGRRGRIRLLGWPAPIIVFFYTLIWRGCMFDGWRGWLYVLQRTIAEAIITLEVVQRKLDRSK